jgi:hypothetical protein
VDAAATDYAKITPRHLRLADEMCPRRLACEIDGQRGNRGGDARFAVSNRFEQDVRLAHTELAPPDRRAFAGPAELLPEQQRVYAAAVAGYLALFGDEPARVADLTFDTVLDDLEVRLVGPVGIPLDTPGGPELRVLRLGDRGFNRPLLDDVDLRFAAVRAAVWVGEQARLRVVVANVLDLAASSFEVDMATELPAARDWLEARVLDVRLHADRDRVRAGSQCLGCGFVSGCRAHAVRS